MLMFVSVESADKAPETMRGLTLLSAEGETVVDYGSNPAGHQTQLTIPQTIRPFSTTIIRRAMLLPRMPLSPPGSLCLPPILCISSSQGVCGTPLHSLHSSPGHLLLRSCVQHQTDTKLCGNNSYLCISNTQEFLKSGCAHTREQVLRM